MSDGGLKYFELDLPPALGAHVRCIWRLHGSPPAGGAAEPIVPDGCVEVVINVADAFVRHEPGVDSYRQPLRIIAGQISHAITIEPFGRVDLWGIRFHPWSAASFLGVSASELRDRIEPLNASPIVDRLLAPVADASTDDERRACVVAALTDRARQVKPPADTLARLATFAARATEDLSVRGLAARAGVGTRRVQQIFADQVGLSPNTLMRITRFQRALAHARARPGTSWGRVAAEAGYYDHAHFVHDCHQFGGCAPSEFARNDTGLTEAFLRKD
jgi:methylphosphotriester-DNA--protein-cysteine methyltransferase